MPLVINTPGWVKGLGHLLIADIVRLTRPQSVAKGRFDDCHTLMSFVHAKRQGGGRAAIAKRVTEPGPQPGAGHARAEPAACGAGAGVARL